MYYRGIIVCYFVDLFCFGEERFREVWVVENKFESFLKEYMVFVGI